MEKPNPERRILCLAILSLVMAWGWLAPLRAQPASQKSYRGLEAYDRGDLPKVRSLLAGGKLDSAEADFLRAALIAPGDEALEMYRQVVLKYPESPLGVRAMERVRQYYYALGLYAKAEEFAGTLKNYQPQERSLKKPSQSPSPVPEAQASTQPAGTRSAPVAQAAAIGNFALQLGAFSQAVNARELAESLKSAGYPVQVVEAAQTRSRLHLVRVTGFRTSQEAQAAAADLQRRFHLQPILVRDNP